MLINVRFRFDPYPSSSSWRASAGSDLGRYRLIAHLRHDSGSPSECDRGSEPGIVFPVP